MREWAFLLGGFIIWTAHFFAAYIFASLFPGTDLGRWLTAVATILAVVANAILLRRTLRPVSDAFASWLCRLGAFGATLSTVAVLWQGLAAWLG